MKVSDRADDPAVDNGIDLPAGFGFNGDFRGIARPKGKGWDIGAFEKLE